MQAVLSVIGALAGVALGAALTARWQRLAWERQERMRSVQVRREAYAAFLAATREWRSAVMGPDALILPASAVSRQPHADGGEARVRAVRMRAELSLAVHDPATYRAAADLMRAVTRLAEARAGHAAGTIPEPVVQECRDAERDFVRAARAELGSPAINLG